MTAASTFPSLTRRIRTYALAGTLAAGLLFPMFQAAQADSSAQLSESGSGLTISVETVEELAGLTAVIAGNGENVHLRAEATGDSESLLSIPDGTVVDLRVDHVDTVLDAGGVRWWPVSLDGTEGWVDGRFLTQATTAAGEVVSSTLIAFDYTDEATAHSTAKVFGNGQHVNVRADASATGEIVTKADDGEIISLRIDMVDTVTDSRRHALVAGYGEWNRRLDLRVLPDQQPRSIPETRLHLHLKLPPPHLYRHRRRHWPMIRCPVLRRATSFRSSPATAMR